MHGLALAVLLATRFSSVRCGGVAFTLPDRWTARATEECDVEVRPPRWSAKAKRSRWEMADPPLKLITFDPGTILKQALEAQDFETLSAEQSYAVGGYSGRTAIKPSRLFLRRGARPQNDDEPTGGLHDIEFYVLKAPGGQVIAFECQGGSPDEPFDCDAAIRGIVATLRLR